MGVCARESPTLKRAALVETMLAAASLYKNLFCLFVKLFFSFTTTDLCPAVPSTFCLQSRCKVDC
jgi:hypothetical protein